MFNSNPEEAQHTDVTATSRDAYETHEDNTDRIYNYIRLNPKENYWNISQSLKLPPSTVSSVLSKLAAKGEIKSLGTSTTPHLRKARTWVAEETTPTTKKTFQVTIPEAAWDYLSNVSLERNSELGTEAAINGDELDLDDLFSAQKVAAEYILKGMGR